MDNAGARIPKMAKRRFRVTSSLESPSPTRLPSQNASEGDDAYLAALAYRHIRK